MEQNCTYVYLHSDTKELLKSRKTLKINHARYVERRSNKSYRHLTAENC